MGFLKFLKREKKEDLNELDLPPAPPPLEGFDDKLEFPEFPNLQENISAPEEWQKSGLEQNAEEETHEFDEQDASAMKDLPEFELPEDDGYDLARQDSMPEFPAFPEIEEEKPVPIPPVSAAPFSEPMAQPAAPDSKLLQVPEESAQDEPRFMPSDASQRIGRRLFTHEKKALRERPAAKTIYVGVDHFKAALGSINIVRSDLKKSESALMKLENIKSSKDRAFDKFRMSLDDLQKKLIFVDKTLFKGGE